MMTKCLNKITTETEISASLVSPFLLRKLDNKTSHTFTALNLHGWLFNAIKEYDDIGEALTEVDNDNDNVNNPVDSVNSDMNNDNDDDDEQDDDSNNEDNEDTYSVSKGNNGLVFVNQMTDYLHRGDTLKHMC